MYMVLWLATFAQMAHGRPVGVELPDKGNAAFDSDGGTAILIASVICLSFIVVSMVAMFAFCVIRRLSFMSEDDLSREEENQAYLELNLDEQELYFQSREYLAANPYARNELSLSQNLNIQEKGIRAWEFVKDPMLTNNDLLIVNRYELNFFKQFECSTQTNLPIPSTNEVYYFESKIYSLPKPDETIISLGIGVKPYPWFRLPGRHVHSICYDSNGYRRHNQPFKFANELPFPKLVEGDVVGIGYRVRAGTVFFTRNGKKVSELKIGGHIKNFKIPQMGQIYPIIGANNLCSVHVNLGQLGYVFIEGNVKKWGFAPLEGNGPAPPAYNKFNGDILLERSEIDDDNDLSERENDFPPDFWEIHGREEEESYPTAQDKYSYNAYSDLNSTDERITLNSLIPNRPPSYDSDGISASSEAGSEDQQNEVTHPGAEEAEFSGEPGSSSQTGDIQDNSLEENALQAEDSQTEGQTGPLQDDEGPSA